MCMYERVTLIITGINQIYQRATDKRQFFTRTIKIFWGGKSTILNSTEMRPQCMKEWVMSDLCGLCGRWMGFNFTAWWPGRHSIKSSYKIEHHITNGPFNKLTLESDCPRAFRYWVLKVLIYMLKNERIHSKKNHLQSFSRPTSKH